MYQRMSKLSKKKQKKEKKRTKHKHDHPAQESVILVKLAQGIRYLEMVGNQGSTMQNTCLFSYSLLHIHFWTMSCSLWRCMAVWSDLVQPLLVLP